MCSYIVIKGVWTISFGCYSINMSRELCAKNKYIPDIKRWWIGNNITRWKLSEDNSKNYNFPVDTSATILKYRRPPTQISLQQFKTSAGRCIAYSERLLFKLYRYWRLISLFGDSYILRSTLQRYIIITYIL